MLLNIREGDEEVVAGKFVVTRTGIGLPTPQLTFLTTKKSMQVQI